MEELNFYFYDIHTKLNYILDSKNRIYISAYGGSDVLRTDGAILWGNSLVSTRWNREIGNQLFSNLTFTYSIYNHSFVGKNSSGQLRMNSHMKNLALKYDFSLTTSENRKINFGLKSNYNELLPAKFSSDNPIPAKLEKGIRQRWQFVHQLYGDANYSIWPKLTLEGGLRLSIAHGRDSVSPSASILPEPMVKVKYQLSELASFKTAYSRNYQFYHSIPIFEMFIPFERFIFSGVDLPPQYADHFSAGYFMRSRNGWFEFSLEAYYSWIYNQFRFPVSDNIILENAFRNLAIAGEVKTYGLELSLRKQVGKFNGLLSYTLAKIDKNEENSPTPYNPFYDRRHDLSLSVGASISRRITISGTWVGMSGSPYSFPDAKYTIRGRTIPYYSTSDLYNKRMPFYHRLDLGCQMKLGKETEDIRIQLRLMFTISILKAIR
ncbi:MAG: TonB-dependent receptor [Bacteroidales bacterium]|nr:TonB-dependent receptor [Bacteroidales bacterium]